LRNRSSARLKNVNLSDKNILIIRLSHNVGGRLELRLGSPKGPLLGHLQVKGNSQGWQLKEIPLKKSDGRHDVYARFESAQLNDPHATGMMFDWLHFTKGFPSENDSREYATVFWDLLNANVEQTPVMIENPEDFKRKTHLFERGSWLSPGKEIGR